MFRTNTNSTFGCTFKSCESDQDLALLWPLFPLNNKFLAFMIKIVPNSTKKCKDVETFNVSIYLDFVAHKFFNVGLFVTFESLEPILTSDNL